jgi:hypothetical protein
MRHVIHVQLNKKVTFRPYLSLAMVVVVVVVAVVMIAIIIMMMTVGAEPITNATRFAQTIKIGTRKIMQHVNRGQLLRVDTETLTARIIAGTNKTRHGARKNLLPTFKTKQTIPQAHVDTWI